MVVHPISALAGYDASDLTRASDTASRTGVSSARPGNGGVGVGGDGFGVALPDVTDTHLYTSPAAARRPLDHAHTNGRERERDQPTPRPGKTRDFPQEPPSTGRKRDLRRGYGVVVGGAADDAASTYSATRDESAAANTLTTFDDDHDLLKLQRQLQLQPDGSLGDSADRSDTPDASGVVLDARAQALRRKAAAGASLKQYEERIQGLTERVNDLQVEVDFYRRTKPPSELESEIIALRKQNKTLIDKEQLHRKMLKEQDKALKSRPLELEEPILKLQAERDALKADLRRTVQDQQRRADASMEAVRTSPLKPCCKGHVMTRGRALGFALSRRLRCNVLTHSFEQALQDFRDEHAAEVYRLERERDELADKLAEQSAVSQSGSMSMRVRNEQLDLLTAQVDDAQHELEAARAERNELEDELVAAERQVAQLREEVQDARGALDTDRGQSEQEKRELANEYEDQLKLAQDQITSMQLDADKQDRHRQDLVNENEDFKAQLADIEYELRSQQQQLEELEAHLVDTEGEADRLEKAKIELEGQLEQRDADLDAAGREADELTETIGAMVRDIDDLKDRAQSDAQEIVRYKVALEDTEIKLQTAERRDQALRDRLSEAQSRCTDLEQQIAEIDALRLEAEAAVDERHAAVIQETEAHKRTKTEWDAAVRDLAASIEQRRAEKRTAAQQVEEYEAELRDRAAEYRAELTERDNASKLLEDELMIRRAEAEELKESMQRMQDELQDQADQSVRDGRSFATEKYTLELENERLQRQVATLEREFEAATKALERQADLVKERDLDGTKAVRTHPAP